MKTVLGSYGSSEKKARSARKKTNYMGAGDAFVV